MKTKKYRISNVVIKDGSGKPLEQFYIGEKKKWYGWSTFKTYIIHKGHNGHWEDRRFDSMEEVHGHIKVFHDLEYRTYNAMICSTFTLEVIK